jgi:hypothetical protein
MAAASNAHLVLLSAMRSTGMPTVAYELAAALEVALTTPEAERRWLAGENVLAGVANRARRPPAVEAVIARIADEIGD